MGGTELLKNFENYLIRGQYRPGDRIPGEQELAVFFGVSRGTMREAIACCVSKGLLERRTSRGTFLRMPALEEIASDFSFQLKLLNCGETEINSCRKMLESAIAPAVVQFATPQRIDELTELNRQMQAARSTPRQADAIDLEFHRMLFDTAGNRLVKLFAEIVALQFEDQLRPPFRDGDAVDFSAAEHRQMIDAIVAREAETLAEILSRHTGRIIATQQHQE